MRQPHDNDLIQDSRLDVTVLPGGRDTKQLSWVPGDSANERPQTIEEIWRRSHQLGSAAGRQVWVEKCVAGRVGLRRVVKEIKITPLDRSGDMSYRQELYAMAKFSQPKYMHCFVKSLGWFETAGHLHLAMEYMPHGDLQKWLVGPFPEPEAAKITSQVVDGLDFMHSSGFAHRDIKPANILVVSPAPKWWVKIADFGISKRIEETSALHTMGIGTSGYMAPEIMGMYHPDDDDDEQDLRYDQKVDIWAMGELVFRMMTAKPSFADTRQLRKYVVKGGAFPVELLEQAAASDDCRDFILRAMAPLARQRMASSEAKEHSWVEASKDVTGPLFNIVIDDIETETIVAKPALDDTLPSKQWTTLCSPEPTSVPENTPGAQLPPENEAGKAVDQVVASGLLACQDAVLETGPKPIIRDNIDKATKPLDLLQSQEEKIPAPSTELVLYRAASAPEPSNSIQHGEEWDRVRDVKNQEIPGDEGSHAIEPTLETEKPVSDFEYHPLPKPTPQPPSLDRSAQDTSTTMVGSGSSTPNTSTDAARRGRPVFAPDYNGRPENSSSIGERRRYTESHKSLKSARFTRSSRDPSESSDSDGRERLPRQLISTGSETRKLIARASVPGLSHRDRYQIGGKLMAIYLKHDRKGQAVNSDVVGALRKLGYWEEAEERAHHQRWLQQAQVRHEAVTGEMWRLYAIARDATDPRVTYSRDQKSHEPTPISGCLVI